MAAIVAINTVYGPSDEIVAREIEGELIIVPLTAGVGDMEEALFTFNETGRAIWERLDLGQDPERPVLALLHLRRDRAERGEQFARLVAGPLAADHVILVGETTDLAEKQVLGFGLAPQKLMNLGAAEPGEVFEAAFELTPQRSVVVGIGNLVGRGERIASYFENRRIVP